MYYVNTRKALETAVRKLEWIQQELIRQEDDGSEVRGYDSIPGLSLHAAKLLKPLLNDRIDECIRDLNDELEALRTLGERVLVKSDNNLE